MLPGEIVEAYMPDLVSRLPKKRTETFDQAFGRMRAKAKRKVTAKQRPRRNQQGPLRVRIGKPRIEDNNSALRSKADVAQMPLTFLRRAA